MCDSTDGPFRSFLFFFFKQKTAYEMSIGDWSSDVCSSDLRDKVIKQGIDLGQVYQTLQTFMGGFFVNYFNRFGRTWQVYIEAEGDYRTDAKNVGQFFVRNAQGDPVPLDAISTIQNTSGPEFTLRYNEYRSAQINGAAAPGYSSYQAMN